MRILITGGNGQLGYWLKKVFANGEVLPTDIRESDDGLVKKMDITNKTEVDRIIEKFRPDVIVHGAAYTNVDGAEGDEVNAFLVNETGTANICAATALIGAKMVYVSTDYVFAGDKKDGYSEKDPPNPQSIYGKSKLAGEKAVQKLADYLICRTAWLYGERGHNFVETMLKLAEANTELKVVNDQIGSPTYTKDLAQAIKFLVDNKAKGIFHTVDSGQCSWYDFACQIFQLTNKEITIAPISTTEFPRPAKRPAYSVLKIDKLNQAGYQMRKWPAALAEYLTNRS